MKLYVLIYILKLFLHLTKPEGADYAHQILGTPSDFLTFRHPWSTVSSRFRWQCIYLIKNPCPCKYSRVMEKTILKKVASKIVFKSVSRMPMLHLTGQKNMICRKISFKVLLIKSPVYYTSLLWKYFFLFIGIYNRSSFFLHRF